MTDEKFVVLVDKDGFFKNVRRRWMIAEVTDENHIVLYWQHGSWQSSLRVVTAEELGAACDEAWDEIDGEYNVGDKFIHHNGSKYQIVAITPHQTTGTLQVIYKSLQDEEFHVRDFNDFTGYKRIILRAKDGRRVIVKTRAPRFFLYERASE